jgi:hypothetical protein
MNFPDASVVHRPIDPDQYAGAAQWLKHVKETRRSPNYYRHWFFSTKHKSIHSLLSTEIWPNYKEFTECAAVVTGMTDVMKRHYSLNITNAGHGHVACYVIGDGVRPQCAAHVSAFTNWNIHSIDPVLDVAKWSSIFPSVQMSATLSEEFTDIDQKSSICIILAVHSHANLEEFWNRLPATAHRIAVALPCCVKQSIPSLTPTDTYIDLGVHCHDRLPKNHGHDNMETLRAVVIWDSKGTL